MLEGKVAIVTGGAGALGRAVVHALLERGARVVVPFVVPGDLERLRAEPGIAAGAPLSGALVDVTDESAVAGYYDSVAAEGGIDVLVNAAGGFEGGKPVHETRWSLWEEQIAINLRTAVLSSRAAVPHMLRRGGGAIVNVASRTAVESGARVAAYAVAKRGVLQLTRAMAAELVEANVTVNAVMPSVIDTPANRAAMPEADFTRWVKPADIARVIVFLAGPDARVVSGAAVPVYGRA